METKLTAGLFIALALFGSYSVAYKYGRHVEFLVQDGLRKDAIIKATKENDNLKLLLQLERQNAESALNILLATPAPRVRMPACRSQTDTAGGSSIPATSTERAGDLAQEAFERFTDGLELDAIAWSRAIAACRVTMEWSKMQGR